MDYERQYRLLINKAWNREPVRGKGANHHIQPKCIGGPDTPENKVRLTHREHFVAHVLLARIFPDNFKLVHAAFRMGAGNATYGLPRQVNGRRYEWLRLRFSALQTGRKFSAETRAKLSASHMGQRPTDEMIEKTRIKNTGRKRTAEQKARMSAAQRLAIAEGRKQKPSHTPDTAERVEISKRMKIFWDGVRAGNIPNPVIGRKKAKRKPHTPETIAKITASIRKAAATGACSIPKTDEDKARISAEKKVYWQEVRDGLRPAPRRVTGPNPKLKKTPEQRAAAAEKTRKWWEQKRAAEAAAKGELPSQ